MGAAMGPALLRRFSVLLFSSFVAGCAVDASNDGEVEATEDAISGASSDSGWFVVKGRDKRKCAEPFCGGWFVQRANETRTRCADGTLAAECYVGSIELSGAGLSPREEADLLAAIEAGAPVLLQARTHATDVHGTPVGTLKATEVWLGATGSTATGTFYRTADNGIRCVTTPCPSTRATVLNTNGAYEDVVEVILDQTARDAEPNALRRASEALATREGILVAGSLATPMCLEDDAACGAKVVASEFFLRVVGREGKACGSFAGDECNPGQFCSWEPRDLCGAANAPGRCMYKPAMCPRIFEPVCGCDGRTYSNACVAAAEGVSVLREGGCADDDRAAL